MSAFRLKAVGVKPTLALVFVDDDNFSRSIAHGRELKPGREIEVAKLKPRR
jgi:hypothetical protein